MGGKKKRCHWPKHVVVILSQGVFTQDVIWIEGTFLFIAVKLTQF